jgi:hypothetical protein
VPMRRLVPYMTIVMLFAAPPVFAQQNFSDRVRSNLQQATPATTESVFVEQDRMTGMVAAGAVALSALLVLFIILLAANARRAQRS